MVLEVLPDFWEVYNWRDSNLAQLGSVADTGKHEDLGGTDSASTICIVA